MAQRQFRSDDTSTWTDRFAELYFDDLAINTNSGAYQNSWPGDGKIVHIRPNEAGDNAQWNRGGTDSGANWSQVEEVPPNDATDYLTAVDLNYLDMYALAATPAAIASGDTINCVMIGLHWAGAGTSANASLKLEIESSASGTIEQSTQITRTATGYATNAIANGGVVNYRLILYDLPGASTTAWTKADLDTAQIGVRLTNSPVGLAQVTAMWLLVDHQPATVSSVNIRYRTLLGVGA